MTQEPEHHRSKKRIFDILLIPADDATKTKKIRMSLLAMTFTGAGSVVVLIVIILTLFYYTPVGLYIPLGNYVVEEKFGEKITLLNQRVGNLMEELVKLKSYNNKLRKALGEKVDLDSIKIQTVEKNISEEKSTEPVSVSNEKQIPAVPAQAYASVLPMVRTNGSSSVASFPAQVPVEGYITRGYDPSIRHYGIDFAAKEGSTIYAAADGHVVYAGFELDNGFMIILSHPGGFLTFYKHNKSLLVEPNSYVKRGSPIATVGNTGRNSYGVHLHFEIWKDGSPVNPSEYLLNFNF